MGYFILKQAILPLNRLFCPYMTLVRQAILSFKRLFTLENPLFSARNTQKAQNWVKLQKNQVSYTFRASTSLHNTVNRLTVRIILRFEQLLCRDVEVCDRFSNKFVSILDNSSSLGARCRRNTESDNGINDDIDDGLLKPDAVEPPFCHGSK